VGLFDPMFKYGYDNDMSYRLIKAGYLLVLKKDAICYHYWKTKTKDYIKQQYWSAYGRMQLLKKHKCRFSGDSVSGIRMILQVPITLLIILFFVCGIALYLLFLNQLFLWIGFSLLTIILFDRMLFSLRTMKRKRDIGVFFMLFFHLLRNAVWTAAFIKWFFDTIKDRNN
jgi:GT2 family glycosyltransferase